MAKIYYNERKIQGNPLQDEFINSEFISSIFENSSIKKFELQDKTKSTLFGLIKKKREVFKTILLSKNNIVYNTTEGNFYLPNAIILYDNNDYIFPTQFYFIAQIDNDIELRKCKGGEDIKWFQIPELHKSENDTKIIEKVKNTLKEISNLINTTFNNKVISDTDAKIGKEKENRTVINIEQKRAYQELINLCVINEKEKVKILEFIDTLKDYDGDEDYYTTLNFVIAFLEDNDLNFIMRMDWKSEVENLEWLIKGVLKENHTNLNIDFPSYNDGITVSHNNIFESFDKSLREKGVQLGFIDTESDEYIAIIHKITEKDNVEKIVNNIGYKYYEK